ncbi:MAG TPA: type II toxin-antitoxin system RelB/DinJ family antitoxin [Candidatus Peribacteraceae bacterium]|nr:type II toxin-antitoxin system RelB/DinJ family antitoxin [Candidatus Peribacteraceae bacterium]
MPKKATANLHIRLPAKLKRDAENVLRALGLDTSGAIRLFYMQITLQQTLPFALPKIRPMSKKTERIAREALASGTIGPFDSAEDAIKAMHAAI